MNRSTPLAAVTAFLLLLSLSAFAAPTTIQFRGQDISYEGAELKWIGEKTSPTVELLLIYTNCAPDAINTFWASRNVTARILVVGGGGAGGYGSTGTTNPGGGGGGKKLENRGKGRGNPRLLFLNEHIIE